MKKLLTIIFVFVIMTIQSNGQNFTQITSGTILGEEEGRNYDCAWADFNNDGFPDLYVVNNYDDHLNYLYKNNGNETFTQITEGDIVTDGGGSYGCSWGDFNNDGYIDLFVCNYGSHNGLYKNNGDETFTKITSGAIVSNGGNSTCADWGDYNNDGFLDLYVTNRDQPNFLYNNNGDETFTKITSELIASESKNSGAGAWGDYDGDGFLDMIIANSGPDFNSLFHNNGDGTFTKIEEEPFTTDYQNFDLVSWGDIDNDGDLDLFASPGMLPNNFDLYLYRNNGDGSFTKISDLPQNGINSAGGTSMVDFDNDADLDIFIMAYDGNNIILENDGVGNFTQNSSSELANAGGYYKNASWADYNADGQMDIFIPLNNYFGGYNVFFQNNGNANAWLKIKCEGSISNAFGVGAIVSVYTTVNSEVIKQTRVISNQQKNLMAHVGLGDTFIADSIVVQWPTSGTTDIVTNVTANQTINIPESATVKVQSGYSNQFLIFPNPTSNYINITDVENALISICNLNGELVRSMKATSQKFRINISDLSTGTYIIQIIKENITNYQKIIIQ